MAAADILPVPPDYGTQIGRVGNVLRGRLESAREYRRQKAPPQRVFGLAWNRHPKADWEATENFLAKVRADFFTFDHVEEGRQYSVVLDEEPRVVIDGFESYTFTLVVVEAVGAAMNTYPTFAASNPSVNVLVAAWEDLGGSGKQLIYAGYGFRVNGSFTSIFLDEVDVTGGGATQTSVPLGLHRLRVTGGPPTSADYLI